MRMITILTLLAALISLTACSSMRGNVVPQSGPTMEQVYDSVDEQNNNIANQGNLNQLRQQVSLSQKTQTSSLAGSVSANAVSQQFHKLPNPELKMYVFPHLSGQDQVPIPGYFTAFNVYEHDYYALPQE